MDSLLGPGMAEQVPFIGYYYIIIIIFAPCSSPLHDCKSSNVHPNSSVTFKMDCQSAPGGTLGFLHGLGEASFSQQGSWRFQVSVLSS